MKVDQNTERDLSRFDFPEEYYLDDLNFIRDYLGSQTLSKKQEMVVVIIKEIKGTLLIDSGASKKNYTSQSFINKLLVNQIKINT